MGRACTWKVVLGWMLTLAWRQRSPWLPLKLQTEVSLADAPFCRRITFSDPVWQTKCTSSIHPLINTFAKQFIRVILRLQISICLPIYMSIHQNMNRCPHLCACRTCGSRRRSSRWRCWRWCWRRATGDGPYPRPYGVETSRCTCRNLEPHEQVSVTWLVDLLHDLPYYRGHVTPWPVALKGVCHVISFPSSWCGVRSVSVDVDGGNLKHRCLTIQK